MRMGLKVAAQDILVPELNYQMVSSSPPVREEGVSKDLPQEQR